MNKPFSEQIYLEQIIEDEAVFEVVNEFEEIDAIFVKVDDVNNFVEGFYYNAIIKHSKEPTGCYLPHDNNRWVYKEERNPRYFIYLEMNIDIEGTMKIRKNIHERVNLMQLKSVLLNELYINNKKMVLNQLIWKNELKEARVKTLDKNYDKYKKNAKENNKNVKAKRDWIGETYSIIRSMSSDDTLGEGYVDKLGELMVGVGSVSYVLNRLDERRFVVYKDGLFRLLVRISKSFDKKDGITCRGPITVNKMKNYLLYNSWLQKNIKLLCENGEMGKDDFIKINIFISKFKIEEFMWKTLLR